MRRRRVTTLANQSINDDTKTENCPGEGKLSLFYPKEGENEREYNGKIYSPGTSEEGERSCQQGPSTPPLLLTD